MHSGEGVGVCGCGPFPSTPVLHPLLPARPSPCPPQGQRPTPYEVCVNNVSARLSQQTDNWTACHSLRSYLQAWHAKHAASKPDLLRGDRE